jgi:2-amino-4-hydroxy-6-hydroxymethyldihydropteridine diphosphokinase
MGYVGVGSNVDPERNLLAALELLTGQVELAGVSTFYRTPPLERKDQPPFANGVFALVTDLGPRQIKQLLCAVEVKLGRRRTVDRHASRTVDLDLLILGDLVVDDPRFRLPDPDVRVRPFVALPLFELAPDLVLPDTREPLSQVAAGLSDAELTPDPELTEALRQTLGGSG